MSLTVDESNPDKLVVGQKYILTFQCPNRGVHRVARESICRFVGIAKEDIGEDMLLFSGRPVYGDANIPRSWFVSAAAVLHTTEPTHPQPVTGYDAYAR